MVRLPDQGVVGSRYGHMRARMTSHVPSSTIARRAVLRSARQILSRQPNGVILRYRVAVSTKRHIHGLRIAHRRGFW